MLNNFQKLTLAAIVPILALSTVIKPASAAGYLVQNATITEVENTSINGNNFAIKVSGGTGFCNNQFILFVPAGVSNANIYGRSFPMILQAFQNNHKVSIYDYTSPGTTVSCAKGGQVVITK
ncbi:DUF5992 family protein [Merismopedia glauca]|uniref:Uncharacterized protein n=1 Tax=Merismopedia glauca CCAP 1448/3 TaxID=1296344 RepID=A0A2T1C1G7_9CYAN|nr:DUF5992 family protein [Merismopedia glauca]PSB02119.1 hypothetical protein C7B64_14670 [Merismopedia glauca CCAP 1448/3]